MDICPECGVVSPKESRQCPRYKGTPVCIDCCMNCKYYSTKTFGPRCMFYTAFPDMVGVLSHEQSKEYLRKLKEKVNVQKR